MSNEAGLGRGLRIPLIGFVWRSVGLIVVLAQLRAVAVAAQSVNRPAVVEQLQLLALRSSVRAEATTRSYSINGGPAVVRDSAITLLLGLPKPTVCSVLLHGPTLAVTCTPLSQLSADDQRSIQFLRTGENGRDVTLLGFLRTRYSDTVDSAWVACLGVDTMFARVRDVDQWFRDYPIPTFGSLLDVLAFDVSDSSVGSSKLHRFARRNGAIAAVQFSDASIDRIGLGDAVTRINGNGESPVRDSGAYENQLIALAERLGAAKLELSDSTGQAYLTKLAGTMRRTWWGRPLPPMVASFLEQVDSIHRPH